MTIKEVDVLIVGGGACGLTASIALSNLGIDHMLVERRATTSHLPKAHYYNQRTMEIFRQHGVADAIYAVGMPMANCKVRYLTSLGGDGPLDAEELYTFDGFGGGPYRAAAEKAAAGPPLHLPQLALEPILKEAAEERGGEKVRFHHEMLSFAQDEDGVEAVIRDRDTDEEYRVRARYMIAADGGRMIGSQLGINRVGEGDVAVLVTAHISADLSDYIPGDAMITHLVHPASRFRWGVFVPVGPTWGPRCEQWSFTFAYHPDDKNRLGEADIVEAIRESMKLPDLPITLHRVSEWVAEATVAEQFRAGRIFLAGDAAHRVIPTSGLGLNSAIHDAHNIAWKLALVLGGKAAPSLLDTYEAERLPASHRNAEWSFFTFGNHAMVEVGLGMMPGQSTEANVAAVTAYVSDTRLGRMLRARAKEIVGTQRTEYGALEIELGDEYDSDAIVADGTPAPETDALCDVYTATTRPGHRLPHAWLDKFTVRTSTHDLTACTSGFSLIIGEHGPGWAEAAARLSQELSIPITIASVGVGCEYADATGDWDQLKEIDESGAILVRPDNIVGFRSLTGVAAPYCALKSAFETILGSSAAAAQPAAMEAAA